MKKRDVELLAPVGDMEKLKTAIHFGADAVYFAGKKFGLRAFSANFEDIKVPVDYCHKFNKKAYITLNIYPRNDDKKEIIDYIKYIEKNANLQNKYNLSIINVDNITRLLYN